jgi:hypothetical protein
MRPPRVRFTVRRMMIAVAVIGLCCFIAERLIHGSEDTVYADGYSEQRFSTIAIGRTKDQVHTVMGAPLRKSRIPAPDGVEIELWQYSESPSGGDYWRRWIWFRNRKVASIDSRFYID